MNHTPKQKKRHEKYYIKSFLHALGYKVTKPEWTDKPDAILEINQDGNKKKIGIEYTDYFNDVPPGDQSPSNKIDIFWTHVRNSVIHRVAQRPSLRNLGVAVQFKEDISSLHKTGNYIELARECAKELVCLVSDLLPVDKHIWLIPVPEGYGLLASALDSVSVTQYSFDGWMSLRCNWECAGNVPQ